MPSASGGETAPDLPPELREDARRFEAELRLWQERGGHCLDPHCYHDLLRYGLYLYEKAADLALIGKGDREQVFTRHLLDSLNPIALFDRPPAALLDVGSGGGLPGLPLAVAWPGTRVVLLESRERKAGFLEQAVRVLGVRNVEVVCARLEDYGRIWKAAPFAAATIRALGDLGRVLAGVRPTAEEDALWIYFLGERSADEVLGGGAAEDFPATVAAGAFGGRLLVGRFSGTSRPPRQAAK